MRAGLFLLVALFFLSAAPVQSPTVQGAAPATASRALPAHIGLGLAASPNTTGIYGWMPASRIPWDYAYQYLTGGVNTGYGWETWKSGGQFPLYYARGAASHHYIPVFSYYDLQMSIGPCAHCSGSHQVLANLNDAHVMGAYFRDFALLMQRLGPGAYNGVRGFGKTAIVHVEPGLSGYAEQAVLANRQCFGYCSGQGNNPALLMAAVRTSGYKPVAAYANTYQGFSLALTRLRDLYAPNVLLAFHVSNWATTINIGRDKDVTIDAAALGREAGQFVVQSSVGSLPNARGYDLIFNDVSDRDAAYDKYKQGYVSGNDATWWDRLNETYPNFHRWEAYIGALNGVTKRPIMVWQIPLGNQYFDTENNTPGHYQDNRAEYFFGHIGELARAGIVGLLFGGGIVGATTNNDAMRDGVTNPPATCSHDGLSHGQICNRHMSTVADDDGGYLRHAAQQYYRSGGYPLLTSNATS